MDSMFNLLNQNLSLLVLVTILAWGLPLSGLQAQPLEVSIRSEVDDFGNVKLALDFEEFWFQARVPCPPDVSFSPLRVYDVEDYAPRSGAEHYLEMISIRL